MQNIQSYSLVQAARRLKRQVMTSLISSSSDGGGPVSPEKYLVLIIPTHDVKGEGTAQQICLKYGSLVVIYQISTFNIWGACESILLLALSTGDALK